MASSFDPASPVPITADDIAWFRNCRAAWEDGESGAPGIVPNGQDVTAYLSEAGDAAAGRLEPILLAIFLNARFEPGLYRLDPPVRATDGWQPGASLPGTVLVRPEHIALLQGSSWVRSFMDDKRPFGSLQYFEADMAILLGRRPPVAADGAYQLSPADERMYQQMHRDMLLVLQAYIQHAALEPGQYALPRDGWDPPCHPRCRSLPPEQLARYQAFCAANPLPAPGAPVNEAFLKSIANAFVAKGALFALASHLHGTSIASTVRARLGWRPDAQRRGPKVTPARSLNQSRCRLTTLGRHGTSCGPMVIIRYKQ